VLVALATLAAMYALAVSTKPPSRVFERAVVEAVVETSRVSAVATQAKVEAAESGDPAYAFTVLLAVALLFFANNSRVLLLSSIPGAGAVFYAYTAVYNARVLREAGSVSLLFKPHTVLEILACSTAAVESTILSLELARGLERERLLQYALSVLLVSLPLLFTAAVVEALSL